MTNENGYLLFAGDNYYPQGGGHDLVGHYGSIREAIEARSDHGGEWANIVCLDANKLVATFGEHTKPVGDGNQFVCPIWWDESANCEIPA